MKIKENVEYITKSAKETMKFAMKFAKCLKNGDIVLLSGDLGAGKTVFAKGFVYGRGIKKAEVLSPTFTIMNIYGKKEVIHFDLYRLDSYKELENSGSLDELFGDGVKLVEWPDKVGINNFPENSYHVVITKLDDTTRKISFSRGV